MLQARPPVTRPDGAQSLYNAGRLKRSLVLVHAGEWIEGPFERRVGDVEVDQLLSPMFRDCVDHAVRYVTVGGRKARNPRPWSRLDGEV